LLTQNPLDLDSKPNNNSTGLVLEDDEAQVSFTIGGSITQNFVINNSIASGILQEETYKFDKLAITEAYPNPVADVLSVAVVTNFEGETDWDFVNSTGVSVRNEKRFMKKHTNQLVFDLTDLPAGLYMIVPKTPHRQLSAFKIIKL
jgi:Secretion system C-terminal sorting domain